MSYDPRQWLGEWPPNPAHAGRGKVLRRGHAHQQQSPALDIFVEQADGTLVVQHVEPTWFWCTRGWVFDGPYTQEWDDDGAPVLCGWPIADLRMLAAAVLN